MKAIHRVIGKKLSLKAGLPDATSKGPNRMHFSIHMQKKLGIYLTAILNCKLLKNKNNFFFHFCATTLATKSPSMAEVDWRGRCTGDSKGLSTFHT